MRQHQTAKVVMATICSCLSMAMADTLIEVFLVDFDPVSIPQLEA